MTQNSNTEKLTYPMKEEMIVITYMYIDLGMTVKEICRMLKVPVKQIKNYIRKNYDDSI